MREEVEARPLVLLVIGLIIGLIAVAIPFALLALAGFLILVRPLRGRLLLASAFGFGLILSPAPVRPVFESTPIHGIGTVSSVPKLYQSTQVFNVQVNGRTLELSTRESSPAVLGDQIRISGVENPVGDVAEGYASAMGIEGRIQLDEIEVVQKGSWVSQLASSWRGSFIDFFDRALPQDSAALVDSVCFNARTMLDRPTQQELKQSGLMHIVTASGLQVFAFGFLVTASLRFFPIPRSIQLLLLGLILCLYSIAAGLNPAIVRASIMSILGLSAFLLKREPDALSALSLAGIGYLLWDPHSIFNAGFQLSFITVACVAFFFKKGRVEPENLKDRVIRVTNEFFRLSMVILLSVLPLSAYYFGAVPLLSMLSNVLVCWCTPLLVVGAFAAYAVSLLLPAVGVEVAVHFLAPLAHWMLNVLGWLGGVGSSVSVPPFSGYWLVAIYGTWAFTYRRRVAQP